MGTATYASRLRYLDAADVDDAVVHYNGIEVNGKDGEKIGTLDGFIVDAEAMRVNYAVVDSGGWFTSRRLLLPIGHAMLAPDQKSLQTDVTRDALRRLPEFDDARFEAFTDEELRAFERNTVLACCPDEPLEEVSVTAWGYDTRRHYEQPDWWSSSRYQPDRLGSLKEREARRTTGAVPAAAAAPRAAAAERATSDVRERELVTARETRGDRRDESPHHDGRAQPGDVLGIETGGERTGIGDTAADEDKWK